MGKACPAAAFRPVIIMKGPDAQWVAGKESAPGSNGTGGGGLSGDYCGPVRKNTFHGVH